MNEVLPMPGADTDTEALWRFSLMLYGRPGAAEALIGLQDRAGHNVNLVLFGLWLAICEGRRLDAAALSRARAAIARLDGDIVQPLRQLRRTLKGDPDGDIQALRHRVLALEIAAERRVQARLAESITPEDGDENADRQALAEANLRRILRDDFGSSEADVLREAVAAIVSGAASLK